MQATLPHDALLPRPPGGNGPGVALSVLAHAGLAVALTVSVDWRTHAPEVVSAELWASVPQVAAPRAVERPPPTPAPAPTPSPTPAPPPQAAPQPRDADIATERRKLEAERQRAAAEAERDALKKRQQAEAEVKKREQAQAAREAQQAREEDERVNRQREENLRRMMSQAGGPTSTSGGTGTAAQDAAPSAAYAGRIVAAVRKNITFTGAINDESSAEVEVRAAPGGSIISSRLLKGSGHKDWDEAVLRALDKTGKLPTDTDGRVPARLILVFKPRE